MSLYITKRPNPIIINTTILGKRKINKINKLYTMSLYRSLF